MYERQQLYFASSPFSINTISTQNKDHHTQRKLYSKTFRKWSSLSFQVEETNGQRILHSLETKAKEYIIIGI